MGKPDLTEFLELSKPQTRRVCKLMLAAESLKPEDRERLDAASTEPRVENSAIRKWLGLRGQDVSINAIVVHRKGECACGRS